MKIRNIKGFSFVEIIVTVTIVSLMIAGGYVVLSSGESSWFTSEASIQVQESLRKALDQMTQELRQSKFDKITIGDGTGLGSTDIILFQVPTICHAGDSLLNTSGDVAHWGATLRWGCRDAACMDADDNCLTIDYDQIRYKIAAGNILERDVKAGDGGFINPQIIARNIKDFQAVFSNPGDPLQLTLTGEVSSVLNRAVTVTVVSNIDIRNK